MDKPLLSVLVTTYNRASQLAQALDSISRSVDINREQVEVIVIDNNCTDNTQQTVEDIRERGFPFALHYVVETNQGNSYARNRGIREAKGRYVLFVDDDQLIEKHHLARVDDVFKSTSAHCVGGPVFYYNVHNMPRWLNFIGAGQLNLGDEVKFLSVTDHRLAGGNIIFLRSELNEIGPFDVRVGRIGDQLFSGADWEIQERLHKRGKTVVYHPDLIQYHFLRPERLKKRYWRKHFFAAGRSSGRQHAAEWRTARHIFGIPGWLWTGLVIQDIPRFLAALMTIDSVKIFLRELKIWERFGQMYEARRA